MTPKDLEELDRLEREATPGPWVVLIFGILLWAALDAAQATTRAAAWEAALAAALAAAWAKQNRRLVRMLNKLEGVG